MKIYQITADIDNHRWLNGDDLQNFQGLNGMLQHEWIPLELSWRDKQKPIGNFISVGGLGISLDEKTKEKMLECQISGIQYLPLIVEKGHVYDLVNVTNVIDCIDTNHAVPRKLSSGKIYMFEKYAFEKKALKDVSLFKIPELSTSLYILGTDKFKNFIEENAITGLTFKEVWDSNK